MNFSKQIRPKSSLPPKFPETLEELERAITLLGNRVKAELKTKARRELEQLLGAYPDVQQATDWKTELKRRRKEELSQKS